MSARIYDFTAIREQVRAVMGQQEPRREPTWITPPSLYNSQERLDADIAWHKRHDKPDPNTPSAA